MKAQKFLLLALIVSAAVSVSAQPGKNNGRGSGSQVAPGRGRSSGTTSGVHYGGGRVNAPSQHFSSTGIRSMPSAYSQHYFNPGRGALAGQYQSTRGTLSGGNGLARYEHSQHFQTTQSDRLAQFQNGRARDLGTSQNIRDNRAGSIRNNSSGLTSVTTTSNHVFATRSADWQSGWDRTCDHWWNGHRCRFINNSWFIFDFGFTPWYGYPYDYYPYDYSYYPYGYDPSFYDGDYYGQGGYDSYGQGGYDSYGQDGYDSYGQNADSSVAAAQERLARQGYYRGRIDG